MEKHAIFSPCRSYRYRLWRVWDKNIVPCAFIGLNPSTADENLDDPTIRRCIGFAKSWGFGGICMLNIFAFRATDPKVMKAQSDPVGPENKSNLIEAARVISMNEGQVIAAWGTHGRHNSQGSKVRMWLKEAGVPLHYLKLTSDGSPNHPLYLKSDLKPQPWNL